MSKDSSAKYYQDNNNKNYRKSSWKILNQQYGRERYKNLSENEKQKLVESRKNIIKWEKKLLTKIITNYFHLENLDFLDKSRGFSLRLS